MYLHITSVTRHCAQCAANSRFVFWNFLEFKKNISKPQFVESLDMEVQLYRDTDWKDHIKMSNINVMGALIECLLCAGHHYGCVIYGVLVHFFVLKRIT